MEARFLTGTEKREHITPVLENLHWLAVKYWIQYKVLVYVYKAVHGMASGYIMELHYVVPRDCGMPLRLTLNLYLPLISIENICFLWLLIVYIWKLYFILSYCYV